MSNVPKLRFKEFSHDKSFANNCGEWEEKKLKTMSIKIGSGSTPRGGEQVYKTSGVPFIRSQNVNHNKLIFNDVTYIDEQTHISMKNSAVKANDILLNITGASIGRSCVVPKDFNEGNVNQHVCIIRLKDNYDPSFIQAFLASYNGEKLIYQGQTGSGREGINFQSIGGFKLNIPSKQEQEKIASFLTSVDTKIEQLTKKEALLTSYKKGVMQKIFSGEIRFKADDGSEFCDWEEKKLGDIVDFIVDNRGKTPPISSDKIIPLIEVNAIGQKKVNYSKISKFVSEDTFNTWFRKYLQNGDLLFSTVGQTAICSLYKDNKKAVIAQNIVGLRFNTEHSEFIYYMLTELNNHRKIKSIEMGAVQPSIKVSQLIELFFFIPNIQEQTKIANFLSSIDSKIEQIQKQLNSTKEFKKALLQQMFV